MPNTLKKKKQTKKTKATWTIEGPESEIIELLKSSGRTSKKRRRRAYRDEQDVEMQKLGYVTIAHASTLSCIPRSTLYRLLDDKKVMEKRVGVARYISLRSLKKYLGPIVGARIAS